MTTLRLERHLQAWLGAWPPEPGEPVTVVGSTHRTEPSWDGSVRPVVGVATPDAAVLSVPPEYVDRVRDLGSTLEEIGPDLGAAVDRPDWRFFTGVFRWTMAPVPYDRPGEWLDRDDERVPPWLRPFNGDVLIGFDGGEVAAGVGRKLHDDHGHELAVVTEEGHRGRGWAKRLVSQAAERVLSEGAVPTYLHGPGNEASARTADASGFPDRGWRVLGLFQSRPG